jgi:hypothetical protein
VMRLKRVDLPVFGRPTIAMRGNFWLGLIVLIAC